MFRIYVNGTLLSEELGYHNALAKAQKCKSLYCNSIVTIEDIKSRIVDVL